MGAILAIDFGLKRIGLALCDPERRIAVAIGQILNNGERKTWRLIKQEATLRNVKTLLVGNPLNEWNSPSEVSKGADRLAEILSKQGFEIIRWDEAFTTAAVLSERKKIGGKGKPTKEWADTAAATVLLQSYLDEINKR